MSRVLVETEKRGWYVDAANPEGKRVRKSDGDQVFDNLMEAQEAQAVLEKAHGSLAASSNGHAEDSETRVLTSGKLASGRTIEIRCQWKGEDGERGKRCENTRIIKPQDAFQVRFCVEHQRKNRLKLAREKRQAKAAQRKSSRGTASTGKSSPKAAGRGRARAGAR